MAFAVSGRITAMAMQVTTWQVPGSRLGNRALAVRGDDRAPRHVIPEHHDSGTITFFDDDQA